MTHALYRSVVEPDNEPLIEAFSRRVDAATATMFASASDAVFADLAAVSLTLLTTIFGTVRSVFEQLVLMCIAYLAAVRESVRFPRRLRPHGKR